MGGLGLGNLGLFLFLVLFQAWVVRVLVSLHTAAQVEAHRVCNLLVSTHNLLLPPLVHILQ